MLPFLKPRKQTDVIIEQKINSEGESEDAEQVPEKAIKCAEDILAAIAMKDAAALAKALLAIDEE